MSRTAATRRNVLARLVAEGGLRLGGFLMYVLIGRYLGVAGFGINAYLMAVCAFAAVGADFGLRSLTVMEGGARGTAASGWAGQAFWLRLSLALLSVAVMLALGPWMGVDPVLLLLGGLWVLFFAGVDALGGWGLALHEPGYEAGAAWIQRAGSVALAALLLVLGWGLRGVWLGQALGVAAALAWLLWAKGLPRPDLGAGPRPREWGPIFRASLPLGLAVGVTLLQTRLLWLLLAHWRGKDSLALLAVGAKFFELGQALPALVLNAALPLLAQVQRGDPEAARRSAGRLARLVFGLILPYSVAMAWRAAPLLAAFGKGFGPAGAALPWFMAALLFSGWNYLLNALLVTAGDGWAVAAGLGGALALGAGLAWAWVPGHGFVACAWIQLCVESLMTAFYSLRLARRHAFTLDWAWLAPRAALAFAAGSGAALALPGLAGAAAGAAAALLASFGLGLLRREDLSLLRAPPPAAAEA